MCEFQAQPLFHSLPLSLFLSQTTNGSFKLSTWTTLSLHPLFFQLPFAAQKVCFCLSSFHVSCIAPLSSLTPSFFKAEFFYFSLLFLWKISYFIPHTLVYFFFLFFLLGFGIWSEACCFSSPLNFAKFFSHHFHVTEVDLICQLDLQLCYYYSKM